MRMRTDGDATDERSLKITAVVLLKRAVKRTLAKLGYRIQISRQAGEYPPDFDENEIADITAVRATL